MSIIDMEITDGLMSIQPERYAVSGQNVCAMLILLCCQERICITPQRFHIGITTFSLVIK